jgi:hypothetical protein
VVIVPDDAGGLLIRGCVGRAAALKILRGRKADDVISIHLAGLRIEFSFHDSIEAAEAALKDAVQRGVLAGALAALIGMENVVLTPHVGSAMVETRQAMGDLTVENLIRFFEEGKVTSPVPECAVLPAAQ